MVKNRIVRLNSLLKEVISEVIRRDVRNPHVNQLITVTQVEITKDLHHAKVSISVIGTPQEKEETIKALQSAAGFIAIQSSRKVVMRYFPALTFKLDSSVDHQFKIDSLLTEIHNEQKSRQTPPAKGNDSDVASE
ncbi:MAG: 30S ribosome-binding factor RbfA [Rhabdochlamydiaceae bacterium]|nr:30S ribosome-binding factor RbfA [Rhabdochlamydiaceae bacterium]